MAKIIRPADQASGESELMDYFLCNRWVSLEDVTDDDMLFTARGYCDYYDEDMADRVIRNLNSVLYDVPDAPKAITTDDMRRLMTEIFVKNTMRLRFCAAFRLTLSGRVEVLTGYEYGAEYRTYTPHPQLDRYSSLGSNERYIVRFLRDRNYIGAIDQCIAACRSLNFGDSAVMRVFARRFYGIEEGFDEERVRCIELPDGRIMTPCEAAHYIKEQEAVNG
jgi:hypothetical protein